MNYSLKKAFRQAKAQIDADCTGVSFRTVGKLYAKLAEAYERIDQLEAGSTGGAAKKEVAECR